MASETVAAICTPHGRAGLSAIRVSGAQAIDVVGKCLRLFSGKKVESLEGFSTAAGEIVDLCSGGTVVDQVVIVLYRAPKSFTGENVVEIFCHGNPLICHKIMQVLFASGAHQAGPGEFTRQAFANGKVDLIQAQAIHELVMANNSFALTKSMDKLRQGLSKEIKSILAQAFMLIAVLEASFEFSEEQDADFDALVAKEFATLEHLTSKIRQSLECNALDGSNVKLALIGVPNAGKSTLFNFLVGHERSIVTSIAGTTRDFVESTLYHQGELWNIVDTAGIRQTNDLVEKIGVQRSFEQAQSADLVIFVFDLSQNCTDQDHLLKDALAKFQDKLVLVANKTDIQTSQSAFDNNLAWVKTCAGQEKALEQLKQALVEKINLIKSADQNSFLLSEIQKTTCQSFVLSVDKFKEGLGKGLGYELLAKELLCGTKTLGNLTAKDANEQVYDAVFSTFCVGK